MNSRTLEWNRDFYEDCTGVYSVCQSLGCAGPTQTMLMPHSTSPEDEKTVIEFSGKNFVTGQQKILTGMPSSHVVISSWQYPEFAESEFYVETLLAMLREWARHFTKGDTEKDCGKVYDGEYTWRMQYLSLSSQNIEHSTIFENFLPVGETANGANLTTKIKYQGCSLDDQDDWNQFRIAVRATIRETPPSTAGKGFSPSPSPRLLQQSGNFSFSGTTTPKKELDKRTVSPHRFPLLRTASLASRPTPPPPPPPKL
ncbi:uncharacterized protein LOC132607929 [Lycium barbarum]|uniref:uncharacterized protein LOC132607929 n=1 Tax=Lycium barbarum TaxID=112863 RepID=UPI00293E838D|nr:uncharacterized protein LOC132607929 [Lycium barbarum]